MNETKIRIPTGSMVSRGIQRAFVTFVSAAKEERGFIESESERARWRHQAKEKQEMLRAVAEL